MFNDVSYIKNEETLHLGLDIETSHNIGKFYGCGKQYVGPDQVLHERNIMTIQMADFSKMRSRKDVKVLIWDSAKWRKLAMRMVFTPGIQVITDEEKKQSGDYKILREFTRYCNKYQRIKVYTKNGKKFDWPFINGRIAMLGLPALPPVTQVDVEELIRKNMYHNAYGLDYLCRSYGVSKGKIKMERQDWYDFENGCERAKAKFLRYGPNDVVDTWKLYKVIAPHVPETRAYTSIRINNGLCPHCLHVDKKNVMQKRGHIEVLSGWKQRWYCNARNHPKDKRRWFTESRVQRDY